MILIIAIVVGVGLVVVALLAHFSQD